MSETVARANVKDQVVHVRNTETPSMHRRMGSATLSQLAFPMEGNPNFPWDKSHRIKRYINFFSIQDNCKRSRLRELHAPPL